MGLLGFHELARNGRGLLLEHGSGIARGGGSACRAFPFVGLFLRLPPGRRKFRISIFRCGSATIRVDGFRAEFGWGLPGGVGFLSRDPTAKKKFTEDPYITCGCGIF